MSKQIQISIVSPLFEVADTFTTDIAANAFVRKHKRIQNEAIRHLINKAGVYAKGRPFGPRWVHRKLTQAEREYVSAYPVKITIKNVYESAKSE